ncbi:MAG: beta-propeller fold lactonase family protein [Planctomycetes bacterium]|nr:beta-propeller fold lactonase family protein [Planctomycetota bacterium]
MRPIFVVLSIAALAAFGSAPLRADLVISANDGKLDLSTGERRVVEDPPSDSLTVIDLGVSPRRVMHIHGIRSSVIGPPTCIAIAPDEKMALVTCAMKIDPADPTKLTPDRSLTVVDLEASPPVGRRRMMLGAQPSGISIAPEGNIALVANRADGTVTVLEIEGKDVRTARVVSVGDPGDEPSHVAIDPRGSLALVSLNRKDAVRVLRIQGTRVVCAGDPIPVCAGPYRIVIAPDGNVAFVAGVGHADAPGVDAISILDLTARTIRVAGRAEVGMIIESIDISPDGRLIAATVMEGSNLPPQDPKHRESGRLVILARSGSALRKVQSIDCGPIPQGVAFTPDGRHAIVQIHPKRELIIYDVAGDRLKEAARVPVPGMPSSIRTAKGSR